MGIMLERFLSNLQQKKYLEGGSRARVTSSGEMYPTTRPLMVSPSRIEDRWSMVETSKQFGVSYEEEAGQEEE
jgi:hypothetical protein